MKREIRNILFLFLAGFAVLVSDCRKQTEYIYKYYGSWSFENRWTKSDGPFYFSDTTYFTGSIYQGSCRNCLIVIYSESQSLEFKVEPDGQILNHCEPSPLSLHSEYSCSGFFEGDSLFQYEIYSATPPNRRIIIRSLILGKKI